MQPFYKINIREIMRNSDIMIFNSKINLQYLKVVWQQDIQFFFFRRGKRKKE